jgi:hypothetical protein
MASGFCTSSSCAPFSSAVVMKGGAHRVRRVATIEPEHGGVFANDAVDRVGVRVPALLLPLLIVLERPEQRPLDVGGMAGEIGAEARGGLWVDRQRVAPAALPRDAQRVIAPVSEAVSSGVCRT